MTHEAQQKTQISKFPGTQFNYLLLSGFQLLRALYE